MSNRNVASRGWARIRILASIAVAATSSRTHFALAENPCTMEIWVFDELEPCANDTDLTLGTALLVADGKCRTVETKSSPTDPNYSLLPGTYRAVCVNSTAVRFLESGCESPQCNSTSQISGATCNLNNHIAGSLYSLVETPEFTTFPSQKKGYSCTQLNSTDITVSFVIFGNCSSPSCSVTNAPVSAAPTTKAPTTVAPITSAPATPAPITVSTPSSTAAPTASSHENPTQKPIGSNTEAPFPSPSGYAPQKASAAPSAEPGTMIFAPTKKPKTDKSTKTSGVVAGVAIGVTMTILALVLVLRRRSSKKTTEDAWFGQEHIAPSDTDQTDSPSRDGQKGSNTEIWIDPYVDDVSTLGAGAMPLFSDMALDEPTASINLDFDFRRNQYRTGDFEDYTQSQKTTGSTILTPLSKLGIREDTEFSEDLSFEKQFAERDNDVSTAEPSAVDTTLSNRVISFELRAPPGKLGMVFDTPNGSVPMVRAIAPDSALSGRVQVEDRLISVDDINVTSMSALEVSNLISQKRNQSQRRLVFCRKHTNSRP